MNDDMDMTDEADTEEKLVEPATDTSSDEE